MTRRLAQQIVIAGCAALLLIVPLATTVAPDPTLASQTPSNFHWARKPPQFTVQVGSNITSEWSNLFRQTVDAWNRNETVTMKEVGGTTNRQSCSPTQGKIELCSSGYGQQEGWLGLTRLFFDDSGNHVEAATVQMNDSFLFAPNSEYNSESARRHTICHELGHSIGLDHVNTNSCMNDSQFAVFNNLSPINKDFNELERIYQHKDSNTTVAGVQKKDKKDKKNKKGKKNKKDRRRQDDDDRRRRGDTQTESGDFFAPTSLPAVPSGLAGDETVTVQTLDNGRKMVTFITWADGG